MIDQTQNSDMKLRLALLAGARIGIKAVFDVGQWMIVVQAVSFAGWKGNIPWLLTASMLLRFLIMIYIVILINEFVVHITGHMKKGSSLMFFIVSSAICLPFGYWIGLLLDNVMHILAQSIGVP